jgi:hypothetical protein
MCRFRNEWDMQETMILKTDSFGETGENDFDLVDGPMDLESDEESDGGMDEDVEFDDRESGILALKHGEHRLTLLKEQQHSLMADVAEDDEDEEEEDEDDDSESSEDVDVDALYNWRAKAV